MSSRVPRSKLEIVVRYLSLSEILFFIDSTTHTRLAFKRTNLLNTTISSRISQRASPPGEPCGPGSSRDLTPMIKTLFMDGGSEKQMLPNVAGPYYFIKTLFMDGGSDNQMLPNVAGP